MALYIGLAFHARLSLGAYSIVPWRDYTTSQYPPIVETSILYHGGRYGFVLFVGVIQIIKRTPPGRIDVLHVLYAMLLYFRLAYGIILYKECPMSGRMTEATEADKIARGIAAAITARDNMMDLERTGVTAEGASEALSPIDAFADIIWYVC